MMVASDKKTIFKATERVNSEMLLFYYSIGKGISQLCFSSTSIQECFSVSNYFKVQFCRFKVQNLHFGVTAELN